MTGRDGEKEYNMMPIGWMADGSRKCVLFVCLSVVVVPFLRCSVYPRGADTSKQNNIVRTSTVYTRAIVDIKSIDVSVQYT